MPKADVLTKSLDPRVRFVVEKFSNSKDYYRKLRTNFTKWDEIYHNVASPKKYDWMSNLVVPATHKSVMTLLSRIVNHTFSVDPNFDVVPSNKEVSNLIRSQIYRGDLFTQWVLFCLQLLVRGTSIGKVSWRKIKKTRFSLEKVMEQAREIIEDAITGEPTENVFEKFKGYQKKPKEVVKYDGPIFETIDLFDYYPEPTAIKVTDGARVFRSIRLKDEVMRNSNYQNKDKVLSSNFPQPDEFNHPRLKGLGLNEPSFMPPESLKNNKKAKDLADYVEILECETKWYNPKTKRLEPWLIVIGNREILLRDEPFPYWNTDSLYLKGVWIPILNEFYGVGLPELTESLQEELNDKRNQRIDNVNQVLQPIFMYEDFAVDPRVLGKFERKPGGKLRLKPGGINATKWDVCPDVTGTAIVESQNLERDIEEVTGAVKPLQATSDSGDRIHRTSSGLMMLQAMASEKIKLNLSILEKQVIEPMLEKFYDLNLQFLTPNYKIFDPEGKPAVYQPEMIAGDFEFRAKGSRYAVDQQMKLMNVRAFLETLSGLGIPPGELHIKLAMQMYNGLGFEDGKTVEGIIRQEIAKFKQMQAQLAQAKAGGGGGAPVTPDSAVRDMTGLGANMDSMRSEMTPMGTI